MSVIYWGLDTSTNCLVFIYLLQITCFNWVAKEKLDLTENEPKLPMNSQCLFELTDIQKWLIHF